ncbi:MAG: amidase [Acidimicrobiia bacterium]
MDRAGGRALTNLADRTAVELLALYAAGEASPVEAVEACLERIGARDGTLNAVVALFAERALEEGRQSTERWMSGCARGFDGVPFGAKDVIGAVGRPTTGGSALYEDWHADVDSTAVARLRAQGGILVAKLQTWEFASGGPENQTFGNPRNPWDLHRSPGGSSSGSAVALAGRELPIALGTDTGGSIRRPAAFNGVVGLKPTYGRVSRHGVMGLSWTLDHVGPMARTVLDVATTLGVIAGHDELDPTSSVRPVPHYASACASAGAGLRIGVPSTWFLDRVHPAIVRRFEEVLEVLRGLGMSLHEVDLPSVRHSEAIAWTILVAEAYSLLEEHLPTIADRDELVRRNLSVAPFIAATDYIKALRVRALLQRDLDRAFEVCDVLVTPGSQSVAPPSDTMLCDVGEPEPVPYLQAGPRLTMPFNVTGSPAVVVPAGLVEGLPVAVQFAGRPHDDATVLAVAAAYERESAHHLVEPPFADREAQAEGPAPAR